MDATPDNTEASASHLGLSQQPPFTPNVSKQKRKRALSNVESPSPGVKKAAQTKGFNEDNDMFNFNGSSDGEVETNLKARGLRRRVEWPLTGSSKADNSAIDMPPPSTKSTSRDQSRSSGFTLSTASDPVTAKSLLSENMPTKSTPNESKTSLEAPHFQGKTHTSTAPSSMTNDKAKASDTYQIPQVLRSSAIAALQTLPVSDPQEEPSSSASLISPSKTIVVERVTTRALQLQHDDMEDELSQSTAFHTASTIDPIVLLPQRPLEHEHPYSVPRETYHGGDEDTHTNISRKRKAACPPIVDDLDCDDIAVGLPKEQYHPRPSRSRAGHASEGLVMPVDFSKRPETVAKATVRRRSKIRRSKTTAFQELRPPSEEDEGEEQPLASKKLDLEKAGEEDGPIKSQLSDGAGDAESEKVVDGGVVVEPDLIAQKSTKKRGRPRKAKTEEDDQSNPKGAEKKGQNEAVKQEPTTSHMTRTTRKKGEEAEIILAEDDGVNHGPYGEEANADIVASERHKVLEQSTGNATTVKRSDDAKNPASGLDETSVPPETPKKPAIASGKGSDKHSPISSSKVAYRVGLSKKARIEPLLRIVRK